jgi:hypothetical protein
MNLVFDVHLPDRGSASHHPHLHTAAHSAADFLLSLLSTHFLAVVSQA